MSQPATVQAIERAIRELSEEDLAAFRVWFSEFDAEAWDRSLEEDVTAGRLEWLAREALEDFHGGRSSEL